MEALENEFTNIRKVLSISNELSKIKIVTAAMSYVSEIAATYSLVIGRCNQFKEVSPYERR